MEKLAVAGTAMPQEESLVKLSKKGRSALSVSPVVNTRAYHDAFLAMPLPKPVCESTYRQAGRILTITDGTEYEYLVAIDARTGALIADNLNETPAVVRATGFQASEIARIKAHPSGIVALHNHPRSMPPSLKDIITTAVNSEIVASVIVGHDGSVWYMAIADSIVVDRLERAYNSLKHHLADSAESIAVRRFIEEENGKLIDWRRLK